jgi:hypothetical protein
VGRRAGAYAAGAALVARFGENHTFDLADGMSIARPGELWRQDATGLVKVGD